MQELGKSVAEQAVVWGAKIIGVLVLIYFAYVFAGWAQRRAIRSFENRKFDPTLGAFFANLLRYAIIVFAVLGCLGVFGVETTSFAAVIGAAGLAIGLAFQGTLSNFAAGIMLLVFRPFKVGDVVKVADEIGTIAGIELFYTDLTTGDNRRIIIPNSQIFGSKMINITHFPTRRVDINVGVGYDADVDETRRILEEAAKTVPGIIEAPPVDVVLLGLGDSSVDWQVRVWCKTPDYWTVWQATIRTVKKAIEENGQSIPFPQMDVHLDESVLAAMGPKRPAA